MVIIDISKAVLRGRGPESRLERMACCGVGISFRRRCISKVKSGSSLSLLKFQIEQVGNSFRVAGCDNRGVASSASRTISFIAMLSFLYPN